MEILQWCSAHPACGTYNSHQHHLLTSFEFKTGFPAAGAFTTNSICAARAAGDPSSGPFPFFFLPAMFQMSGVLEGVMEVGQVD